MSRLATQAWNAEYDRVAEELPQLAAGAPMTLCGMSACIDACATLPDLDPLFSAGDPDAAALAAQLLDRVRKGIGGEIRVDWPQGPAWLDERIKFRYALGGTGPQAAWTLSTLGAPALIALQDRSAHMLASLPGGVLLLEGRDIVPASRVQPRGLPRPHIYIVDYTKDVPAAGVVPPRSSRVILRFHDLGLEHDIAFDTATPALASNAGAGLISGFNCVPPGQLALEIERVFSLAARWRDAGLNVIHLELASGYNVPGALDEVLRAVKGVVTSIGMSHSEFRTLCPAVADLPDAMILFGERLELDRVCVHADQWASAATRRNPRSEGRALMAGCLLASARAQAGHPVRPYGVAERSIFDDLPYPSETTRGRWNFVTVASPYLAQPTSTLGLGDTFTAGCLLVLGCGRGET